MGPKPLAIFWDNAAIHWYSKVVEALKGIPYIFNVPYAPDYNGIEKYWGLLKQRIRVELTKYKLDGLKFNV